MDSPSGQVAVPRTALSLIASVLLGLLLSSSCRGPALAKPTVSALSAPVRLPYRDCGVPMIEAHIPGAGSGWFIVDSGSSHSLIDARFATRAGLDCHPFQEPLTTLRDGEVIASLRHYARVPQLHCGSAIAHELLAPLVDLQGVPGDPVGLIGQDLLSRWTVLFDPTRGELCLCPDADSARALLEQAGGSARRLPTTLSMSGVPRLNWTLDGEAVSAVVDTGATHCALPEDVLVRLGSIAVGEGRWHGLEGPRDCAVHELRDDELGLRPGEGSRTVIGAPGARVGFSLLSADAFVLDGPGQALWLLDTRSAGG